MKIGIYSAAYFGLDHVEEGFTRMKAHGYDCVDYQNLLDTENALYAASDAEMERTLRAHARAAREAGIEIIQTHGPWRWPPKDAAEEDRAERFAAMSRALRGTAQLGCRYMAIHPVMPFGADANPDPERFRAINLDYYGRLTRVAEQEGVVLCLENMPMPALTLARPAEILTFVKEIGSENLKICLDTGHCAVCGVSPADAVRELGDDLKIMHVHDNDGTRDQHLLPFEGVIDWADFARALQEKGFTGSVSLETQVSRKLPGAVLEYEQIGLRRRAEVLAGRA